jgi:hypothetical protein
VSSSNVRIVRELQPEGDLVAFFDQPRFPRDRFQSEFESAFVV